MGGKLCFDIKQISETNKRTSKLVCTTCTGTILCTGLSFYFSLQFLQRATNISYDVKLIIC